MKFYSDCFFLNGPDLSYFYFSAKIRLCVGLDGEVKSANEIYIGEIECILQELLKKSF